MTYSPADAVQGCNVTTRSATNAACFSCKNGIFAIKSRSTYRMTSHRSAGGIAPNSSAPSNADIFHVLEP